MNLPFAGSVRVMSVAYMEYSPAASMTTTSPDLNRGRVVGIVQHGGVEARSHDRRVGRALAATLSPFVLQERGDFPLGDAGLHGVHGGQVRGDRRIRGFADQFDFALVFERAQGREQRA